MNKSLWQNERVDFDSTQAEDAFIHAVKALMLAVLEDAMRCYEGHGARDSQPRREAEAWLFDRRADGPFAFDSICEALGFDPDYLRGGVRLWRLQKLAGTNPPMLARRSPVMRDGEISPRRAAARAKSGPGSK
jgi:hypothetical protein